MRLLAPPLEDAVDAEVDIFGRDGFLKGLLRLFESSDEPMVIALDEQWGTGKTVFAKRLERKALKQGFPVVYFDAFKFDYEPDVFVSLASAIIQKLPNKPKTTRLRERAKVVAKVLARVGLKSTLRMTTMGIVSLGELEKTAEDAATEIRGLVDDELDALIEERLGRSPGDEKAFEQFRESLSQIYLGANDTGKPLIFIIDELDRCKPSYALAILETIKHFFAVKGVKFLLVCQANQIFASVKHAYGNDVDAQKYLEKFIHHYVYFPVPDAQMRRSQIMSYVSKVIDDFPSDNEGGSLSGEMADFITNLAVRRDYSLRRIERVLTQFAICLAFTKKQQLRLGAVLFVLCDLKCSHPGMFLKAKRGELKFQEIMAYYQFDSESESWYIDWLQYFFDENVNIHDPKWRQLVRGLAGYSMRNPKQTALYFANSVVDCISVQ